MKKKNTVGVIALLVILVAGAYALFTAYQSPITYDGSKTDVYDLYQNPTEYSTEGTDGIADIIVKETLEQTNAVNAVTAVVFDFRGYDTMGEAFILITAISGSMAILRRGKKGEHEDVEEEHTI